MARLDIMSSKVSVKMIMILLSIFVFTTPADAFFRHLCFNPLGYGRIDPIVSPGKPAPHLHHLHGSGNLGIDSVDANYLLEANCTSCSITLDKSAYWAPAMYFQHANGSFELMTTAGSITIYYKTEKRVNFLDQNYTAFPKGFRMVAGDPFKREWVGPWPIPAQSFWGPEDTSQKALASKALGFNCLDYQRNWQEATFAHSYLRSKEYIDANCKSGVRAEVLFPSCWDGVNLDSPDHKSHVAYPTLLQDGACPKTHPVFLPILFYETIWNTQPFAGVPGQFVFSNGDPTGYGYHADFIAAWEDGVLEQIMANPNCTDQDIFNRHNDGLQEHCPIFEGHLQSPAEAAKCKLEVPEKLATEKFVDVGLLNALPGNMPIIGHRHDPGTDPADFKNDPQPSAAPNTSVVSVRPPTQSPVTPSPVKSTSPPAPTISPSVTSHDAPIVATSTITYYSNGIYYEVDVVQQLVTVVQTVTPTPTSVVTTTNTTTATVRQGKQHLHGHMHRGFI